MKKNSKIENIVGELIKSQIKDRLGLDAFKRRMAKKYQTSCPTNAELLKTYHKIKGKETKESLERLLRTRPVRSLSGIVNVSVLTKPYPCPGKCIFCPSQKGLPKSYLEGEPAVNRALLLNFSPKRQVQERLKSLQDNGHPTDKIELRIIGGTWSFYSEKYKNWFVKECFRAANNFSKNLKEKKHRKTTAMAFILRQLKKEQKENEKTKSRIIGISVETRPDFITAKEAKKMRELGITRVELGVQSIYNNVLRLNKRGHGIRETITATKILKDFGFKVSYQIMPNLPGSSFKKDVEMAEKIFSNPNFKPDLLKIYPLALVRQSALYKWYQQKKYKPYNKDKLIKLLVEIKKKIPWWCRIQRIIRDIPAEKIVEGGAKILNLREYIREEMKKEGLRCHCIRCREIKENYKKGEKIYLFRENYQASGSKEIFLSFENEERTKLFALLRLRLPNTTENCSLPFFPALREAAIIREIHTYGQMAPIGKKGKLAQHRGLGKKLVKEAEKIARKEFKLKKIAVISGVGVRNYWRKLNYKLNSTYMIKKLPSF